MESATERRWRRAATLVALGGVVVSSEALMTAFVDRDPILGLLGLIAGAWALPQAVRLMRRV
ncbi:MAG: hypothetical protein U1E63_16180 [Burkholderiales bacterium]